MQLLLQLPNRTKSLPLTKQKKKKMKISMRRNLPKEFSREKWAHIKVILKGLFVIVKYQKFSKDGVKICSKMSFYKIVEIVSEMH